MLEKFKSVHTLLGYRFTKAERELRAAKPFGYGPRKFYQSSGLSTEDVDGDEDDDGDVTDAAAPAAAAAAPAPAAAPKADEPAKDEKKIYVAVTSDRGLCGGVHSGVCRRIRGILQKKGVNPETDRIVCLGEKSKAQLRRLFKSNILITAKEIGRISPVFADASRCASAIAQSGYPYDIGDIFYNKFVSAVKYELTEVPFFTQKRIEDAPKMTAFEVDPEDIESYAEWTLAALLYYAMKQSACSEQSARMAAMDNATKNAAEMIRKLTLLFNRTRQAVITRELIEIISGAAALK